MTTIYSVAQHQHININIKVDRHIRSCLLVNEEGRIQAPKSADDHVMFLLVEEPLSFFIINCTDKR